MPRRERSLELDGSPLLSFAAELRALRRRRGMPPYRVLAEEVHYAPSTLWNAASGRRLPSLEVVQAFVRACGADVPEWTRRWHQVAAALPEAEVADRPAPEGPAPYPGSAAFDTAQWFFGRESLAGELLIRVRRHRFVTVVGASGAGKTSLLRAGLLPRLRERPAEFQPILLRPRHHPLEECAIMLANRLRRPVAPLLRELRRDPLALHRLLAQLPGKQAPETEVVLVVEKFEELFARGADAQERSEFLAALCAAVRAEPGRCRVVAGVRADVYQDCLRNAELAEAWRGGRLEVGPLTTEQLRQAIVLPAARTECTVAGELLAELIAQTAGRPAALPLLSQVLLETWHHRRGNTLSLAGYQAAGGFGGLLARTAEQLHGELSAAQRQAARDLLLRLVPLGEVPGRVTGAELRTADELTAEVLDKLAAARLVSIGHAGATLAHPALAQAWPRLREWVEADPDGLRVHRDLTEATRTWLAEGRDSGALYRGRRLTTAVNWLAGASPALLPAEREFLTTSRAVQDAVPWRATSLVSPLAAALTLFLLVAVTTTGLVWYA